MFSWSTWLPCLWNSRRLSFLDRSNDLCEVDMSSKNVCKVVDYVDNSNGSPVLTVNFDCGHLIKQETDVVKCEYLENENATDRNVLLVSRKNQIYKGTPAPASQAICQTLYLVRNKRTGKARLVSSSSCQLVNCTNSRNVSVGPKKDEEESDQRSKLVETFGSKRAKRLSDISARIRATTSNYNETLENTIHDMTETLTDIQNAEGNPTDLVKQLLPPCDREAAKLSAVYPLDGLLTKSDLRELRPVAELYLNPPDDVTKDETFIVSKFYKSIEGNLTLLRAQLLLYANSLVTFVSMKQGCLNRKDAISTICPHSKVIALKIVKLFTTTCEMKRLRTQLQADRAVCFAIVAILLACDYKIDLDWFFECLKGYRVKHVQGLMRSVGLVPTTKGSQVYALQLPLPPLPTTKFKKKRN